MSGVHDLHICGICRKQFSDINKFVDHKHYICTPPMLETVAEHCTKGVAHMSTTVLHTNNDVDQQGSIEPEPEGTLPEVHIQTENGIQVVSNLSYQSLQLLQRRQLEHHLQQQQQHIEHNLLLQQQQIHASLLRDETVVGYQEHLQGLQQELITTVEQPMTTVEHPMTTCDHQMTTVEHPITIVEHPITTVEHPITTVEHSMTTVEQSMTTVEHLLATGDHQMTTSDHQMTTSDPSTIGDLQRTVPNEVFHNHVADQESIQEIFPNIKMMPKSHLGMTPIDSAMTNSEKLEEADQIVLEIQKSELTEEQKTTTAGIFMPSPSKFNFEPVEKKKFSYKCSFEGCKYVTQYAKNVERHMLVHTGAKPFECEECNARFSRADKLRHHQLMHSGYRPHQCTICSYNTYDSGSLKKHKMIHTDERPHKCQICSYASRNSSQLTVHLRIHTGDKPFMCPECNNTFKVKSDLTRHRRTHTGEKPYKCDHCEFRSAVKSNLTTHMKTYHCEENMIKCVKCDFQTSSKRTLRIHTKDHETSDQTLMCKECHYICSSERLMTIHLKTHEAVKPFSCPMCAFTTKSKSCLNSHMKNKHPKEYFFKLGRRGRMTAIRAMELEEKLRKRMPIISTCLEKFHCDICGAKFVHQNSMRSHARSHKEKAEYEKRKSEESEGLSVAEQLINLAPSVSHISEDHEYALTQQHTACPVLLAETSALQTNDETPNDETVSTSNDETVTTSNDETAASSKEAQYKELQNLLPFVQNNHNTAVWENMQNLAMLNQGNHVENNVSDAQIVSSSSESAGVSVPNVSLAYSSATYTDTSHHNSLVVANASDTSTERHEDAKTVESIRSIPAEFHDLIKSLNLPPGTVISLPYGDHEIQIQTAMAQELTSPSPVGNDNSDVKVSQSLLVQPLYITTDNNINK